MRLALYEKELRRLLQSGREHDFVIFEVARQPDQYVQFMIHDGTIYGEVGSRQWGSDGIRLKEAAEAALACLGFGGGGREKNYSRDRLPKEPRRLACLTELLFGAAYGVDPAYTPLVQLPRTPQQLTLARFEA
jgi:hypothetical protein